MKTAEVCDILSEQIPIPLQSRHYVRFSDGRNWIDVELRNGEVTVRSSRGPLVIRPSSSNQITVDVEKEL